jgi:F-type H+-transporting ATPase subunit c
MLNMLAILQQAAPVSVGGGLTVIGGGLAVLGAGVGIGMIGGRMTEAMARQPEVLANIQTGAIILAALIEGAALFGLVIAGFIK